MLEPRLLLVVGLGSSLTKFENLDICASKTWLSVLVSPTSELERLFICDSREAVSAQRRFALAYFCEILVSCDVRVNLNQVNQTGRGLNNIEYWRLIAPN